MRSQRHTIVVVEDDPAMSEEVSSALSGWGYVVDVTSDGPEALERIRRHPPPRAVLLDLVLPSMSGWEVVAELKKSERLANIPVVVISAFVSTGTNALPAADAYFGKPLDLMALERVLRSLCS